MTDLAPPTSSRYHTLTRMVLDLFVAVKLHDAVHVVSISIYELVLPANKTCLTGCNLSTLLVDQTGSESAFSPRLCEVLAALSWSSIAESLLRECHRWNSSHTPTVTTVTGIVTAQYIQNSGDTVHCSSPPSAPGAKWKKLMLKSACELSARAWLNTSQRTYAYVCARQEQHAEDADPFSGLPVSLRGQRNLAGDGCVVLRVPVESLR